MEESRKQFEAEIKKNFGELIDQRICKNSDGDYMAWDMQVAWWAWQASRAAIEVDLQKPKQGVLPGDYHIGYDSGAESQYESDVESIRAAGLKIKGE